MLVGVTPAADAPPEVVRRSFGIRGEAHLLPGGQGATWLVDGVVLKRHEDPREAAWVQGTAAPLQDQPFRIAPPVRAADGSWVVDGWSAIEHLPGLTPAAPAWDTIIAAGRAFADAAAALPMPPAEDIARRSHRWAVADRCAWGEQDVALPAASEAVHRGIQALTSPIEHPRSVIHADLAQNVHLDQAGLAVILDLSLYVRPIRWADAIVVADAVTWLDADPSLAVRFAEDPVGQDLLARALIFRFVAEQTGPLAGLPATIEPYERLLALLSARP